MKKLLKTILAMLMLMTSFMPIYAQDNRNSKIAEKNVAVFELNGEGGTIEFENGVVVTYTNGISDRAGLTTTGRTVTINDDFVTISSQFNSKSITSDNQNYYTQITSVYNGKTVSKPITVLYTGSVVLDRVRDIETASLPATYTMFAKYSTIMTTSTGVGGRVTIRNAYVYVELY